MTPPDDDSSDRDAILARRAIFLSTALAALHCSSPRDPATKPTSTYVVTDATSTSAATTSATARTSVRPASPLPAWSEILRLAPPRDLPQNTSANEKRELEYLEQALSLRYAAVKDVWEHVPDCDAADPGCRPRWREVGDKMKALFDATRGPMVGGCGGARGFTGTVSGRDRAHRLYVADLMRRIEERLTEVAAGFSAGGEQEWRKLLANAKEPPPMPCLSPCMVPEVQELSQAILFDKNASTLREDATVKSLLEGVAATYKANRKPSSIEVRGHADPGETNPQELAKARAATVAKWLEKAGVPRAQLREKSFAADAPVDRSDKEDTAAQNRRVDFEAVPK